MPVERREVDVTNFESDLEDALNWVAELERLEVIELLRNHIPEENRVEEIPPAEEGPEVVTDSGFRSHLAKSDAAMKEITDYMKLRKSRYAQDIDDEAGRDLGKGPITFSLMAFLLCPLAFIEPVGGEEE